jgi:hypothetical protein
VGIHTQANFGKVAKVSNAYFSGLYRGIVGDLRSISAKWCRDCWAMDEDWPLTHERHTTNCPAFIRSTTVSEGGGCSFSAHIRTVKDSGVPPTCTSWDNGGVCGA